MIVELVSMNGLVDECTVDGLMKPDGRCYYHQMKRSSVRIKTSKAEVLKSPFDV